MIPWEIYVLLGLLVAVVTLLSWIMLKDTDNHIKWLNEEQKKWDEMKRLREEREKNVRP
jgi:4-amino-4-deoxy-L-arabinose transferase-like glycosyltransferase